MEDQLLSWRERGRLWFRLFLRVAIFGILIAFLSKWLPQLVGFFMPFFLAFLLAWALNPLIRFINQKCGIPRKPVAFVLILIIIGALVFLISKLIVVIATEVYAFAQNWNTIFASLQRYFGLFEDWVRSLSPTVAEQIETLLSSVVNWIQTLVTGVLSNTEIYVGAGNVIKKIPDFLVALLVFVMASYFYAADFPKFRSTFMNKMPERLRNFISLIKNIISAAFGGYVKAEFLLSVGVFIILGVGFFLIKQNYTFLLAIGLAILDFIPIIGAGTIMVPWAIIDVINGRYEHALALLIIWGVIALFRRLAEPKVLGDQTGLSPVMSLFAVFLGMKMGGILGMVLGPVLVLIVLNVFRSGVFDGLLADLRAVTDDLYVTLKQRPPLHSGIADTDDVSTQEEKAD